MSTPNKTAPDFYEPWQAIGNHLYDRLKHHKAQFNYGENAERSALCVNACAGMSDPAAEIQALRDKLEQAEAMIGLHKQECSLLREKLSKLKTLA